MKKYTRSEVEQIAGEYFKDDTLARDVWINKYALKDSDENIYETSPNDMHKRIASEISRTENKYSNPISESKIYDLIKDFKYIIPQGGPMSGIGNNLQTVSLSNCFVVGNESDSYGGIMTTDQEQAQLMKRRGGVGHDLSHIRPKGMPVKNSALTSTGVVPFMERFSNTTREVAQDGRRGALMLSINVLHPDAEAFIDAKLEEGKVTGANVSVKLTDSFMECVRDKKMFTQKYPIDSDEPIVTKEIDAVKLWEKIVYNAWKSAEPGLLFWDTVTKESIPDEYTKYGFETKSTNPCFPSSEYLLTENGYSKFGDLFDKKTPNNVICDSRISYVDDGVEKPENWKIDMNKGGTINQKASEVFLTQASAEIIEIKTSKGFSLKCTPDHHIATIDGMIEAKDLTIDHKILIAIPSNEGSIIGKLPDSIESKIALLSGLVTGDGCFDKNRCRVFLDFWGDDKIRMKDIVTEIIDSLYNEIGIKYNSRGKELSKYFISNVESSDKIRIISPWLCKVFETYDFTYKTKHIVPEFIMNQSATDIGKYYVAGLMYSDGSVQGSKISGYTIRLSQSNAKLLKSVQMILHSNGILTGLYKRRDAKMTILPDTNRNTKYYQTKAQYELITIGGGIVPYREKIGFLGDVVKEEKMMVNHNFQVKNGYVDSLVEVIKHDNEPVFCIKEDIGRNIIVNGISARRCGEIPLCPYDSCRLLSLNLYSYVENPFTPKAKFNFELFKEHSKYAQKFMDDIVDLEIEKIDAILEKIKTDPEPDSIKSVEINLWEKIKEKSLQGRRTGLGITAEGDMLAALGLKYGTTEATEFSTSVHKTLAIAAYESSIDMAQERGAFEVWDYETEINNPFLQRIISELSDEYKVKLKKYGRRNIAALTIAPTGCLVEDTKIKTENGITSMSELFLVNGYDLNKLRGLKDVWLDVNHDTFVYNINGNKNKITKLYWNGECETRQITFSDNNVVESSLTHKYLVKINDDEAIWKTVSELEKGDKILKLK